MLEENTGAQPAPADGEGVSQANPETGAQSHELDTEETTGTDHEAEGDGEGDGGEGEAEEVELDLAGQKMRFPKNATVAEIGEKVQEIAKSLQSDYTRKSQEAAEVRKAAEAKSQAADRLLSLNEEAIGVLSRGMQIRNELEQLEGVDLRALWQSPNQHDRDQARQISDRINVLRTEFGKSVQAVQQYEAKMQSEVAAAQAKRAEDGKAFVAKRIPGFSPQIEADIVKYAVEFGIPEADAKNWAMYPESTVLAWKAMQFDRMTAKAKAAAKPSTAAAPPPVEPIKGTKSPAKVDPNRMSTEQWMKWRQQQVARGR